jgi:transcriptional regulator with XRE-family HTH domain
LPGDDLGRAELARFLRSRRERVSPTQVGLPASRRRRAGGLRREEVAILAGVSPTWYTYLEQGRKIRPSPAVLDSLAKVLLLSEEERQYMHLLVYGHRPRPLPQPLTVPMVEMAQELTSCFGRCPHPMYAFNEVSDLVAWNDAAADWYTDFHRLPADRRNMMWWMLTDPEAQDRLVNWEEDCRDVVARYRGYIAMRHNEPRIRRFVAELRQASPLFTKYWVEHEVHAQAQRVRQFRHPVLGVRSMRVQVVVPTESDDLRIAFHLPAPSGHTH